MWVKVSFLTCRTGSGRAEKPVFPVSGPVRRELAATVFAVSELGRALAFIDVAKETMWTKRDGSEGFAVFSVYKGIQWRSCDLHSKSLLQKGPEIVFRIYYLYSVNIQLELQTAEIAFGKY
ncbi:hypothetical protein Zmor_003411 [Zophobas morio]|uniref:Uncharacterized protein n=1 Tax=Zophobas morio TaxID=2755281 RepID=A0AA38HLL7_9CUCU|nr:hypothetical protein Zmor_003411 [Zophobas morio]